MQRVRDLGQGLASEVQRSHEEGWSSAGRPNGNTSAQALSHSGPEADTLRRSLGKTGTSEPGEYGKGLKPVRVPKLDLPRLRPIKTEVKNTQGVD